MKGSIIILSILALMVTGLLSCKKDGNILNPSPSLSLKEVLPTTVKEFTDSVVIIMDYKDGDGDLGYEEADSFALRVQDSRLLNPDWYHISPLAPPDKELSIQGSLKFTLKGLFLLGNGGQETTTFSIQIRDRAGNWSNELITPVITIVQ